MRATRYPTANGGNVNELSFYEKASWSVDEFDWWHPDHQPSESLKQGFLKEAVIYYAHIDNPRQSTVQEGGLYERERELKAA